MKRFGLFTVLGGYYNPIYSYTHRPSLFALSYTSSSIDDKGKAWAYASYVYSCLAYASGKADSSVNDFVFLDQKTRKSEHSLTRVGRETAMMDQR